MVNVLEAEEKGESAAEDEKIAAALLELAAVGDAPVEAEKDQAVTKVCLLVANAQTAAKNAMMTTTSSNSNPPMAARCLIKRSKKMSVKKLFLCRYHCTKNTNLNIQCKSLCLS